MTRLMIMDDTSKDHCFRYHIAHEEIVVVVDDSDDGQCELHKDKPCWCCYSSQLCGNMVVYVCLTTKTICYMFFRSSDRLVIYG